MDPSGVALADHIVYTAPNLESAVDGLNTVLGSAPRRRFDPQVPEGPEMVFFRFGETFIEFVATGWEPALVGEALKTRDVFDDST